MPDITWTHPALPVILGTIPATTRSLLDAGCGRGIIGALCRIYRDPRRLLGIDAHAPSLGLCRRLGLYDEYLEWDLARVPLPCPDREFDVATCIEVIEHLPRPSGERLLDELERVARRVIVSTPGRFFEQEPFDGNPYQHHLSAWSVSDFRRRGYAVYGVGDLALFGRTVPYVSEGFAPLTRRLPSLSTLLLCVKDGGGATRTDG